MDTKLVSKVTEEYTKIKHPKFNIGDIVEVHTKIIEGPSDTQKGDKEEVRERIQIFKGVVISIKGSGITKRFTVRKISYGIGVEKIFPLYSPTVAKIKIVKRGEKVKRSKLYYLRQRVGKKALKAGLQVPAVGEDLETKFEESLKEEVSEDVPETSQEEALTQNQSEETKNTHTSKDVDNTKEKNTVNDKKNPKEEDKSPDRKENGKDKKGEKAEEKTNSK